jgi:hypothetical protein
LQKNITKTGTKGRDTPRYSIKQMPCSNQGWSGVHLPPLTV